MSSPSDAVRRLRVALDLHRTGEVLMRRKLRRRHPAASDEEIERMLVDWLLDRSQAPLGDAVGRPGPWPRR